MNKVERDALINQLDRSYAAMPSWAQAACRHAMGIPLVNRKTGAPFKNFREALENAADWTLETLKDDFDGNGDLLPAQERPL
ncbi:hypothetical protein [Vreelandella titanicae]|uniref:hypothetical protein n=1 Tax=Vreelandella titanicae TaxID=664683 RepID=UPI0039BFA01B